MNHRHKPKSDFLHKLSHNPNNKANAAATNYSVNNTTTSKPSATNKTAATYNVSTPNKPGVAIGNDSITMMPQLSEAEKQLKSAHSTYDEQKKLVDTRLQLRESNSQSHDITLNNLDSSIKRCTGFKNKLSQLSQLTLDILKKEVDELNLTKYIDEISIEMSQLKLMKNNDLIKYMYVSSILHQRYPTFTPPLIAAVQKQFNTTNIVSNIDEMKSQRIVIRMYLELLYCGLTDNCGIIMQYIAALISYDTQTYNNDTGSVLELNELFAPLQLVIHFLRHAGEELLGIVSNKMASVYRLLSALPLSRDAIDDYHIITQQQRMVWYNGIQKYVDYIIQRVSKVYKSVKRVDRRVQKQILLRGEPLPDAQIESTRLHELYDKLVPLVQQLCDVMGMTDITAELHDDTNDDELSSAAVVLANQGNTTHNELSLYIDMDEQQFYENILDLRTRVPPLLLSSDVSDKDKKKLSNELKQQQLTNNNNIDSNDTNDHTVNESIDKNNTHTTVSADDNTERSIAALDDNITVEQLEQKLQQLGIAPHLDTEQYKNITDTDSPVNTSNNIDNKSNTDKLTPIDLLLDELSNAYTIESINSIAEQYCYMNTKPNRQKLIDRLYYVHWTNMDMVCNYSRLVAVLYPYIPEIGKSLIQLLQSEFYYLLKQKTTQRYESKVKNIRYIIELTKFHVCPPIVVLTCMHACILQFSNYTVPALSTICEYCGYWLHKNAVTTAKFNQYVDTIKLLKQQKFMDLESLLQLDNALNNILPQPTNTINQQIKSRPVLHQYIRYLLYTLLSPRTTENVLEHMRCLPWHTDDTIKLLSIKCFTNVYNIKYNYIACLASVLSGLDPYHNISVYVVDSVLNELYNGQRHSDINIQYQRQFINIKYLGELYAYRLCDTQTIFDTMYMLIDTNNQNNHTIDTDAPPSHVPSSTHMVFNTRLVLTLLDVVSKYFDHGALKKRLERYLLYFQHYVYQINTLLPIEVEFGMVDLFTRIKPVTPRYTSLMDINTAIDKIQQTHDALYIKDRVRYHVRDTILQHESNQSINNSTVSDEHKSNELDELSDDDDDDDRHSNISNDKQSVDNDDQNDDNTDNISDGSAVEHVYGSSDDTDDTSSSISSMDSELQQFQRRRINNKNDELDSLFDRMMVESVESRKYDSRTNNITHVPSAEIALSGVESTNSASTRQNTDSSNIRRVVDDDNEYIEFKLLSRNVNNKSIKSKSLLIPMDTDLALSTINNEQLIRDERAELKKLVLAGIQREAAAEYDTELYTRLHHTHKRDNKIDLDFSHRQYDPSNRTATINIHNTTSSTQPSNRRDYTKGPKLDLNEIAGAFPEFKSRRRKY